MNWTKVILEWGIWSLSLGRYGSSQNWTRASTDQLRIVRHACTKFIINQTIAISSQKAYPLRLLGSFLNRYHILVLIDSYATWPKVFSTSASTASFVSRVLRKSFSRKGISHVLITDKGSQFWATELECWLDRIGCRNLCAAPRQPCSKWRNGELGTIGKKPLGIYQFQNVLTTGDLHRLLPPLMKYSVMDQLSDGYTAHQLDPILLGFRWVLPLPKVRGCKGEFRSASDW